jgi:hypothetical protein
MDTGNDNDNDNDDDTSALGYCNSFKRHTRINDIVTYALKAPVKVCHTIMLCMYCVCYTMCARHIALHRRFRSVSNHIVTTTLYCRICIIMHQLLHTSFVLSLTY